MVQEKLTVPSAAVQPGLFSIILLMYHQESNTVYLLESDDTEDVECIPPNKAFEFNPEVMGQQYH